MKTDRKLRGASFAAAGFLLLSLTTTPTHAAPVITTVNADLSANPFSFSFMGGTFTFTGTGGFPNYLSVSTTGGAAVRTVFDGPSTDFPGRGTIIYDQNTLGGYGAFAALTTIPYTNGGNFLGLRVTSGGQDYYGFLYSTDTTLNSYGFETMANVGIMPTTDLPAAAVPEAASWAMMIGGFGIAGAAVRSRRRVAVRYA